MPLFADGEDGTRWDDGVGTLKPLAVAVVGVRVRVGADRELSRGDARGWGERRPLLTPASPIRTSISMARSRSQLTALSTTVLRRSSEKPMSRSLASLFSRPSPLSECLLEPKTWEILLRSPDPDPEPDDSGRGYDMARGRGEVGVRLPLSK